MERGKQLVEASNSLHQHSDGSQRPTMGNALAYLKVVKEVFKDTPGQYDQFLEVMKAFKAKRLDAVDVIIRTKALFKGHPSLISDFNIFLPKGYEITYIEDRKRKHQPVDIDPTRKHQRDRNWEYFQKIKTRFQNHEEPVYETFRDILHAYADGNKSKNGIYGEVAELFHDHQDLIEEFSEYLP